MGPKPIYWVRCLDSVNQPTVDDKEIQVGNTKFLITPYQQIKKNEQGEILSKYIRTTPGRILLNESFK